MRYILTLIKKNYVWIWTAVDRIGKRFMDFVIGDRSKVTGRELWERIKDDCTEFVFTDYWKAYTDFVPAHMHIQSKAETYTVEGYNSNIRHFLARFRRRTKCYSKSIEMIELSLILLFDKWNNR